MMLPLLHRPASTMWGERSVLSVPSSPSRVDRGGMGDSLSSPKRAPASGRFSGLAGQPGTQASTSSMQGSGGGVSQFQISHENTLRKNRNHFMGQTEQYSIDYHAAHNKSLAELPVLREQHALEIEEYQNVIEETVSRHVARIAQLRQDYSLLIKEASRRHMELQQRRFAGAKVDIPQVQQVQPAALPPLSSPQGPNIVSPSPLPNGASGRAYDQAASHSMGQVNPNAYLRTLDNGAAAAMSQFTTRAPGATPNGIAALSISSPSTPMARTTTSSDALARGSDFARLEAMHDKYMTRTRSQHEQGISARAGEVSAWQQTFGACMGALAQHQSAALSHLASCVEEAEAWHGQQRMALAMAHEEVVTEAERLNAALSALQSAGAAKLTQLLASFLERVLPAGEVGLAEAQAAYTRSAANLRNEHVAALEAAEATLRGLIPRHAALRQHMLASYSSGLASHEAALAAAGGHYDSRGTPELRRQYEEAEARHRDALSNVRVEHMKSLAASRDSWMGEAAALLEEYRARMQELKSQYMLTYDTDITEV